MRVNYPMSQNLRATIALYATPICPRLHWLWMNMMFKCDATAITTLTTMESSSYEKKSKLFYPMSEKWLRVSAIVPADEWEYYENTEPFDELDWSVEEC